MLRLENIKKNYDNGFELHISELTIAEGIHCLVGHNASGKTTLLNIIGLLLKPDSGRILLDNEEISQKRLGIKTRRLIALSIQDPYMISGTVFDNAALGLRIQRMDKKTIRTVISALLEEFNLSNKANLQARELSGGEKKIVGLIRAISLKPKILLLDEPTANVDADNVQVMERAIDHCMNRFTRLCIIATHNLEFAYKCTDSHIEISDGIIINPDFDS